MLRAIRTLAAIVFFAAHIPAQPTAPVQTKAPAAVPSDVPGNAPAVTIRGEIRGSVVEPGANTPVAEAEVTVDYYGPQPPRIMPSPPLTSLTVLTNALGVFAFQVDNPGFYTIRASKSDLKETGATPSAPTRQNLTLTKGSPSRDVQLFLTRPAAITGTVIDDETGEPLPNVTVLGGPAMTFFGRRLLMRSPVSTSPDGRFTISGMPGDYVVELGPQTRGKDRVLLKFSDEDLARVDVDFERTFWPGGHGEDLALPLAISSGATVDVGRMRVKKTSYYRVHLRVPQSNCRPDDVLRLYESVQGAQFETQTSDLAAAIPCGSDMLITGFAPGSYRLLLASTKAPLATASVPITITSKNVAASASLSQGTAVDGSFVLGEGVAPLDFTRARLTLDPIGMLRFSDAYQPKSADAKGGVRVENLPEVDHRVIVSGLPASHYVKEIRYNGSPLRDGIVPLEQPAIFRSLTILLDDKPATLSGSVTAGDQPVAGALVLLMKWPAPANQVFIPTARTQTDGNGGYQFTGLAPGPYRVLALRSNLEERERPPNSLENAFAIAGNIDVAPRETRTVQLEPTSLR